MKKLLRGLFSSLLGGLMMVSCAGTFSPPRATHVVPRVRMEVHADTSFTDRERELILLSAKRMQEQTSGFLEYRIVFDLDFDSMDSIKEHSKHNIITRVHSSASDVESNMLGYCMVNLNDLDFNNPTKVALIYDRLQNDDAWVHVTMHEMLHMVRLQHISGWPSILYRTTPIQGKILTCMRQPDMIELCTVHGCDLAAMKPCD